VLEKRVWERPDYSLDSVKVGVSEPDRAAARELLGRQGAGPAGPVIGLNPGAAYGGAKRWPAERFAAVADALASQYDARVLIFGSAGELALAHQVASHMTTRPMILAGKTTLGQLMGLIEHCGLFITNDSGPMHLAAALGVPQLAIFGSTSEQATGPLSDRARIIKHPVECNPCFLRECPTDFRCMLEISVNEVVEAARAQLA
jgi:heptosyltransferase-2